MPRVLWAGDNKVYAARIQRGFAIFADGSRGRVERVTCKKLRSRASLVAFPEDYAAVTALAALRDACGDARTVASTPRGFPSDLGGLGRKA
jgi:hypothetical protein